MNFNSIKNMKASECEQEFVLSVINQALDKSNEILNETFDAVENDTIEYNFKTSTAVIFCNIFHNLMSISESIGDLSSAVTLGAVTHLEETLDMTDEEIAEMDDDLMEEMIKPYLDLQHIYADFNNKEIRDMLFETAKQILTPVELMSIYLGL